MRSLVAACLVMTVAPMILPIALGSTGDHSKCFEVVCVEEHSMGDGSCSGTEYHHTDLWIGDEGGSVLYVQGFEGCTPTESGVYRTQGVQAYTPVGLVVWQDSSEPSFAQCWVWVISVVTVGRPCAVAPPNPGWGGVLPWDALP